MMSINTSWAAAHECVKISEPVTQHQRGGGEFKEAAVEK